VQVDPIKPALKARATRRLTLEYDNKLLSNVAVNFNLRCYTVGLELVKVGRCSFSAS